ncbi:MAG: hypothetical protein ACLRWP_15420 [Bilophila wadsworthia]
MREIVINLHGGKLCKYAAGFENTHAHKVSQDMDLLRAEVRKHLPGKKPCTMHWRTAFPCGKRFCPSRSGSARHPTTPRPHRPRAVCPPLRENIVLRLLVFDFEGQFLFEEKQGEQKEPEKNGKIFRDKATPPMPPLLPQKLQRQGAEHAEPEYNGTIGLTYFLDGKKD